MGGYQVILSLLGCVEGGKGVKALVDGVIEACDQVVNLREEVISYRCVRAQTSTGPARRPD